MAAKAATTTPANGPTDPTGTVSIPRIQINVAVITLVGDSPLIVHKWSEKAKKEMLDKQMKRARSAKEAKEPEKDFIHSLYVIDGAARIEKKGDTIAATGARWGFPTVAFKAAAVGACRFVDGAKMTELRGAFHVLGELAEIEGVPTMREDMVRVGMGTADIRYRGEFKEWRTTLEVRYNAQFITVEQITNFLNQAGFGVGVGEWRPEKDGNFGMFHVLKESDVAKAA